MLAKLTGVRIQVGEELRAIRMPLELREVSVVEALDAIAQASDTRWEVVAGSRPEEVVVIVAPQPQDEKPK